MSMAMGRCSRSLTTEQQSLPKVPIIGVRPGQWLFPLARARLRNTFKLKDSLAALYRNHKDETSILPVLGLGDLVFLPIRELQWLAEQPDTIANSHQLFGDFLQTDHTIPGPPLAHDHLHVQLIQNKLTRETGNLIPAMHDESKRTSDELWGTDTDRWREIDALPVVQHMTAQIIIRVFVGAPLCRNKKLQDVAIAFTNDVAIAAVILRLLWAPLRPLFAPLITIPNRVHLWQYWWIIRSEVERRLRLHDAKSNPGKLTVDEKEPNDFLQWSIEQARGLADPTQAEPYILSRRLSIVNFASIHTTSLTLMHVLVDLTRDPTYISTLREEITAALDAHGGRWTKATLADMTKLDSAIRESQRLNNGNFYTVIRKIIAKDGLTTPSGIHLPYGTIVGGPGYAIHHDSAIYSDPDEYRPFRFSDMAESLGDGKRTKLSLVNTGVDYQVFGHGRLACPGRFYASAKLKILLGHLLLHYDFESLPRQKLDMWRVASQIGGLSPKLRVRRRKL
ncbi:putative cytochrome P450 [Immersiella caudata]|uniref:Cytochrome P450 n=1 Tax=Immersiella caudata TaxID=314043 RepID=A0AA39U318_9PEZI|nr:putative cytochrome P450 [Immersiella caudata]